MFLICCAIFAGIYAALYLRILPVPVMRAWFVCIFVFNFLMTGVLSFFVDCLRYVGVPRTMTQRLCAYVCVLTFRSIVYLNPQVHIIFDQSAIKWADIPNGSAMVLNHCSFWDAFLFVGLAPVSYIWNCKTLMKSTLRKIPVFGGVFDRVGHFPVYFKSNADGEFGVDKERQAEVSERVSKHLERGGRIAIFPEGAVNKTPRVLQPFRFGTFATIFQHKLKTYFITMVGNDVTWPAAAPLGGFPQRFTSRSTRFQSTSKRTTRRPSRRRCRRRCKSRSTKCTSNTPMFLDLRHQRQTRRQIRSSSPVLSNITP